VPGHTFDTNIIKGYKVERLPENFRMSSVILSELMTGAVDQYDPGHISKFLPAACKVNPLDDGCEPRTLIRIRGCAET